MKIPNCDKDFTVEDVLKILCCCINEAGSCLDCPVHDVPGDCSKIVKDLSVKTIEELQNLSKPSWRSVWKDSSLLVPGEDYIVVVSGESRATILKYVGEDEFVDGSYNSYRCEKFMPLPEV